jgi:hypothetical protein
MAFRFSLSERRIIHRVSVNRPGAPYSVAVINESLGVFLRQPRQVDTAGVGEREQLARRTGAASAHRQPLFQLLGGSFPHRFRATLENPFVD